MALFRKTQHRFFATRTKEDAQQPCGQSNSGAYTYIQLADQNDYRRSTHVEPTLSNVFVAIANNCGIEFQDELNLSIIPVL